MIAVRLPASRRAACARTSAVFSTKRGSDANGAARSNGLAARLAAPNDQPTHEAFMTDSTEQLIAATGANKAPRVTPADGSDE